MKFSSLRISLTYFEEMALISINNSPYQGGLVRNIFFQQSYIALLLLGNHGGPMKTDFFMIVTSFKLIFLRSFIPSTKTVYNVPSNFYFVLIYWCIIVSIRSNDPELQQASLMWRANSSGVYETWKKRSPLNILSGEESRLNPCCSWEPRETQMDVDWAVGILLEHLNSGRLSASVSQCMIIWYLFFYLFRQAVPFFGLMHPSLF